MRVGLLAVTALRLLVAARAPLSADEAYYRLWSRVLAAGYLDHPPMVAFWIRAGTGLAGETALGVRLLGPLSALFGTLLLIRAADDFWPEKRVGVVAAVLLNATLVLNVGSVVMTPDTPLLFFWTAALACLARLVRSGNAGWWLGVGACAGLALDSKYTAVLLGASIVVWLLAVPSARRWLSSWQLWAGGALALALFAPVLAWNAAHGWASFAKQGGRTGDFHPARAVQFLVELVGGQVGLATPLVAWVLGVAVVRTSAGPWRRQPRLSLLVCLVLVPTAFFMTHALGGRVQANWPAILYPAAVLLAAGGAARFWRPAAWLGAACAGAVYLQAAMPVLSLPRALDFTLIRLAGWSDLAGAVFAAQATSGTRIVVADEYGLASELAWHLHTPVAAVEPRWVLFDLPHATLAGERVLLVRSLREQGEPDARLWSDVRPAGGVTRGRPGRIAETYRFYTANWSPRPGFASPVPVFLPATSPLRS